MVKYDNAQHRDLEQERYEHLLREARGPDDQARAYLSLGVLDERREEWEGAISHYRKCLATGSERKDLLYYGNNNLGFSLVKLERFDEAEEFCLAAIEMDPARHNAHKNLGLVRQGLGHWLDAANCYVEAYTRSSHLRINGSRYSCGSATISWKSTIGTTISR